MDDVSHPGYQAERITAWVSGGPAIIPPGEDVPGHDSLVWVGDALVTAPYPRILVQIVIRNATDESISDVRSTLATYPDGSDWGLAEMRWPEIGPGQEEMTALYKDTGVRGAGQVRLEFTDAMGIRWTLLGRDLRRYLKPMSTADDQIPDGGEMPHAIATNHTPRDD